MPVMYSRRLLATMIAGWLACSACSAPGPADAPQAKGGMPPTGTVAARAVTGTVPNDPDDPAIWVDPVLPPSSLIITTDKQEADGGLYVFGLDGRLRQAVTPMDRPNNVDVEYGLLLGGVPVDVAVVTERMRRRLRVFRIDRGSRRLEEVTTAGGIPVLEGQAGEAGEPMGIGLYRRAADGAVFAIVSPKAGGARDYLWQYRLHDDGRGRVAGTLVRRFGAFSGRGAAPGEPGEIEAVAVDDELGHVYYADERFGIRKWAADPDSSDAGRELAVFGTDGYLGDREGLAVYGLPGGEGYILSADQVPGAARVHVYSRSGGPEAPHQHRRLAIVETGADDTDGLEAVSAPLGPYGRGLLVMMNSGPRTFMLFDWNSIRAILRDGHSSPP
jgi:3-phytase